MINFYLFEGGVSDSNKPELVSTDTTEVLNSAFLFLILGMYKWTVTVWYIKRPLSIKM